MTKVEMINLARSYRRLIPDVIVEGEIDAIATRVEACDVNRRESDKYLDICTLLGARLLRDALRCAACGGPGTVLTALGTYCSKCDRQVHG
jgi:hypothetical protein